MKLDIDIVSWDVDGTLYDMPSVKRAVITSALRGLLSPRIFTNLRELSTLGKFRKRMAMVRSAGGVLREGDIPPDRERIIELESRWYGRAIQRVGLRSGVLELLDDFASAGLRQIVVSDYRAEYKLAVLNLEGRFERCYAGESERHLKPSAELFSVVLEELGVEPHRVLHIGDGEATDGAAARPHGCRVAILGTQYPSAEALRDALHAGELPEPG